jgi:hypothetical protein
MKKIYFGGPSITNIEKKYVLDSVVNGFFDGMKKDLISFEKKLKKLLNINYAHLTFTCTHAMHLALLSCGIKKGDEVIAVGGILGGVGNLIRGIRGEDPIPMAGYGLNTYLDRADNNDAFLKELLAIVARNKGDDFVLAGSRTPSPSKKLPPDNGVIVN